MLPSCVFFFLFATPAFDPLVNFWGLTLLKMTTLPQLLSSILCHKIKNRFGNLTLSSLILWVGMFCHAYWDCIFSFLKVASRLAHTHKSFNFLYLIQWGPSKNPLPLCLGYIPHSFAPCIHINIDKAFLSRSFDANFCPFLLFVIVPMLQSCIPCPHKGFGDLLFVVVETLNLDLSPWSTLD